MSGIKIGDVFGSWTVIGAIRYERGRNINTLRALCECECGTQKDVYMRNVLRGKSVSCGCVPAAATSDRMTIHGEASPRRLTPEYVVWKGIRQRCGRNPRGRTVKSYRNKNITLCERWKKFDNFLMDMGRRPSPEHQIDRIDNSVGYTPENCRWTTKIEQQRNKTTNVNITYMGKTKCIAAWAEEYKIPYGTLRTRIVRLGWGIGKALETPVKKRDKNASD